MFRFVLQVAFIRRVLQSRIIRTVIFLTFLGALIAGIFYAALVFNAVQQRSNGRHVQHHSSH